MTKIDSDFAVLEAEAAAAADEQWQKNIDTTYGWMSWSKKSFHFECGMGWKHIIEDTLRRIDLSLTDPDLREDFSISQIKQKYGYLRIYFDGGDASTDVHVNVAEEVSETICELCGRMGSLRNRHGWLSVRCDECLEARHNS